MIHGLCEYRGGYITDEQIERLRQLEKELGRYKDKGAGGEIQFIINDLESYLKELRLERRRRFRASGFMGM